MAYALGWHKDPPHLTPQRRYSAQRGVALPAEASLSPYVVDVLNQKQLGCCVSASGCQAWRMRFLAQGNKAAVLPSMLYGYHSALAWDLRQRGLDLSKMSDAGTTHASWFAAISEVGICPEDAWPFSDDDRYLLSPSADAVRLAYPERMVEAQAIDDIGSTMLMDIKHAIAIDKEPVLLGGLVSNDFCQGNFDPTKPLDPPTSNIAGGHAMVIEGYHDQPNGSTVWDILNSWTADFGINGRVKFSDAYVITLQLRIMQKVPAFAVSP